MESVVSESHAMPRVATRFATRSPPTFPSPRNVAKIDVTMNICFLSIAKIYASLYSNRKKQFAQLDWTMRSLIPARVRPTQPEFS